MRKFSIRKIKQLLLVKTNTKRFVSNKKGGSFLYKTANPYATLYYSDEQEIYNIKTRRK